MDKVRWKPGTMIYPLPAVMVTCGADTSEFNIITISWTGTVCSDPPMCYISVRPSRYSYNIINRNREFVINLTTESLVKHADWCGVKSGRDFDKFKETGLTQVQADIVKAPMIAESPVNIECAVTEVKELGVHHMFLAEVVAVHASKEFMDQETGLFRFNDSNPICYSHGNYYNTGALVGKFGYSVMKKRTKEKLKKR